MFKIAGALSVMLGAAFLGIRQYTNFLARRNLLQTIRSGCERVENILRCMCAPLHESFESGGVFFENAARKISTGTSPEEAVIETAASFPALGKEDRVVIERFARGLQAQDCKGQLDNLTLFIKSLDKQILQATDELNTRGKLYIKGSILTAAAVVLLLI